MMRFGLIVLLMSALVPLPSFSRTSQTGTELLKKEKKHLECMVSLARKEPQLSQVHYEIADSYDGPVPVVKYQYKEVQMVLTEAFVGIKQGENEWLYQATFGGLACGARALDVAVASRLAENWKTKCGVIATVFCA